MTDASERTDNESCKFGGTQPSNIFVKTSLTDDSGNSISTPAHDYVGVTYPDTITEVYTFKTGGSSGTTVQTITLVYTDSTKANLLSSTKV